jgi:hypothetical protein
MGNADTMIRELKSYPLLAGARGQIGVDTDALAQCLGRLSKLVLDFPEISSNSYNSFSFFIIEISLSLSELRCIKLLEPFLAPL